jgi:putative membrane protein
MGPHLLAHVGANGVDPWKFDAHPDVIVLCALLVAGYVFALRRLGPRLAEPGEAIVTRRQATLFGVGALLLFVFAEWPIHDISEKYLFSVHMLQHTFFSLIIPPILMLGLPGWLLRWFFTPMAPVLRRLCRPIPASLLFNGVVAITHWPAWVNYTVQHELAHFLAHALLFGAATVMWFPVVNKLPDLPTMTPPGKMVYLFLQSILPTLPASFLAFAEKPMFSFYAHAPRISGVSAIEDQQIAGAIMKVGGTMIIWTIIGTIFFRWYLQTERDKGDVLHWEDVERELARTEPAKSPH